MKKVTLTFIVSLACSSSMIYADNYYWIIGGGPSPEHSQSQIELNVKWATNVIENKSDHPHISTFYSDGDNPKPDVVNNIPIKDPEQGTLTFDRVFGGTGVRAREYYNHKVKYEVGTTSPDFMLPRLKKDFSKLNKNDKAFILYNGHGGYSPSDHARNHLRLWGEKKLTVYDFAKLLSSINPDTPVRYVMTQCFSGAFSYAIHPDANKNTLALKGNRCGFMAESATREAEGCSASINIGDYRDYTTFFFAALDGKTRLNKPLASNPDLNNDNKITLREAHLYTLANAYSTDLSRSTSEYYLQEWEPWYLRWISKDKRSRKSVYSNIRSTIIHNNKVPVSTAENHSKLRKLRLELQDHFHTLNKQNENFKSKIRSLQKEIIADLKPAYPDAKKDYKNGFKGYSGEKLSELKKAILKSDKYVQLKKLFAEKDKLVVPILNAERKLTQIEKIYRFDHLSKLDSLFPIFSNGTISRNYNKILSCEDTTL